jgi:hypothetical protein
VSSKQQPWRAIELQGQRTTWAATPPPDVPVLFYYGTPASALARGSGVVARGLAELHLRWVRARFLSLLGRRYEARPVRRDGSRFWTGVPDNLVHMSARLHAALRYVVAAERFDFLLCTNVSAYIHLEGLRTYVSRLRKTGFYGGFLGDWNGIPFASGSGVLMSRDVAESAAHAASWDYDVADDVAVGRLMHRLGVTPDPIPRMEITDPRAPLDADALARCYLVRCKSDSSRDLDVLIMRKVHAAYVSGSAGHALMLDDDEGETKPRGARGGRGGEPR